jgi:cell division protein FtsB
LSNEKSSSRQRRYPPLLVAVVVAVLVLLGVASLGSYRDLQAAQERQALLEEKIESTQRRNEELARKIHRLQEDPLAIESLAREQYRMMYPDDVVIILPEEPSEATAVPPISQIPSTSPPGTG